MIWIKTSDRLPPPCKPVLAYTDGKHTIRAMWVAPMLLEMTSNDFFDDGGYDEATDTFYLPQGWYENNQHEDTHWVVDDKVTHWMHLPDAPTIHKPNWSAA